MAPSLLPSLPFGQSSSSSERLDSCRTLRDQLLAQLPQTGGAALILGLGRGQAAEAVVEVHASQSLQLRSQRAVHRGGRPLLLWTQGTQRKSGVQREIQDSSRQTQKETVIVGEEAQAVHIQYLYTYIYLFIPFSA